jgi:peptidoglycan/LPS O-acetylase OafA/YrhL
VIDCLAPEMAMPQISNALIRPRRRAAAADSSKAATADEGAACADSPAVGGQPSRHYFPGLDALRFLAAIAVLVSHIEQFKQIEGLANFLFVVPLQRLGPEGVVFFFVLSGFLITYLLLTEQDRTGAIRVGRFYGKRILRIWPLYYAVVAWSFLVLNYVVTYGDYNERLFSDYGALAALFVLMLPNIALLQFGPVLGASQAWSIGVEEQFYVVWPLLVRWCRRWLPAVLLLIAVGKPVVMHLVGMRLFDRETIARLDADGRLNFWVQTYYTAKVLSIEAMACGGLAAWIVMRQKRAVLKVLYSRATQWAALFALGLWIGMPISHISNSVLPMIPASILYAVIIANVATNPGSVMKLEWRWMNLCGRVSYGIYMWHASVIVLILASLRGTGWAGDGWAYNLIMYPGAIGLTLLTSLVSYRFLELPFLKWKERMDRPAAEQEGKSQPEVSFRVAA